MTIKDAYSCDFETLSIDTLDYTYIWAWAATSIDNPELTIFGSTMEEYIDFISKHKIAFFHNAKFDFSFIIDWLFRMGFTIGNREHQFEILMSGNGKMYSMKITWEWKDEKHYKRTTFYDSLKKLPFSVDQLAKSFEMPIRKLVGSIDYKKYRPYGHIMTEEEKAYIENDSKIVAYALRDIIKLGNNRMTIGSDAINTFISDMGKKDFKRVYPEIDIETDTYLRKAYKGGYTYVNERFQNKMVGEGIVLDVNSLYPSRMRYELMPYGKPVFFKGKYEDDERHPLYIQRCIISGNIKDGYLPCLQLKGNKLFNEVEYIKGTSGEEVEVTLTNIDLKLIEEHYDFDITYLDGYKFKGSYHQFDKYIDYFMEVKINNKGAMKTWAKLMLNNLYGKFGSNPKVTTKYPEYGEDEIVHYKDGEDDTKIPPYLPTAIYTTAYARYYTITNCQKNYDRFLYADTDSMHLLGLEEPEGIEIDDDKLGAWKKESTFTKAKYIRPKTYIEMVDGKLDVKACGLPSYCKSQVTFDNFNPGAEYTGKLRPVTVRGGIILKETSFKIKL
ncbi:MAG: hypothetical protein NC131_11510 [Roseburia sp.]|nr:hypothetical protein [Roseburia sp.]